MRRIRRWVFPTLRRRSGNPRHRPYGAPAALLCAALLALGLRGLRPPPPHSLGALGAPADLRRGDDCCWGLSSRACGWPADRRPRGDRAPQRAVRAVPGVGPPAPAHADRRPEQHPAASSPHAHVLAPRLLAAPRLHEREGVPREVRPEPRGLRLPAGPHQGPDLRQRGRPRRQPQLRGAAAARAEARGDAALAARRVVPRPNLRGGLRHVARHLLPHVAPGLRGHPQAAGARDEADAGHRRVGERRPVEAGQTRGGLRPVHRRLLRLLRWRDRRGPGARRRAPRHVYLRSPPPRQLSCAPPPPRAQIAIKRPSRTEDPHPDAYYTRRGIHAVNVQAITDDSGRITWAAVRAPGAMHDSQAFNLSSLARIFKWGFGAWFIVGDEAYVGQDHIATPVPGTPASDTPVRACSHDPHALCPRPPPHAPLH